MQKGSGEQALNLNDLILKPGFVLPICENWAKSMVCASISSLAPGVRIGTPHSVRRERVVTPTEMQAANPVIVLALDRFDPEAGWKRRGSERARERNGPEQPG